MAEKGNEREVLTETGDLADLLSSNEMSALEVDTSKEKGTEGKEDKQDEFNSVLESRTKLKQEDTEEPEEVEEVKDKTKEKDADKGKEKPPSQTSQQSEKVFSLAFAKVLAEMGVVSELSEERFKELEALYKESGDQGNYRVLEKVISDEINTAREQILSTYEEDVKEYIEMLDAGVDKDVVMDLIRDKKAIEGITPEQLDDNEELRKNVLFNYYKLTTKFSDTKINKMIDSAEATGESTEEAKNALTEIKELHKQRAVEERQKAQDEENATKQRIEAQRKLIVDTIDKTDEIFKGVKIAKATKEEIKNMILKPAGKDESGNPLNAVWLERSKNPVNFDMITAYLIKQGVYKGDFTKVGKLAASKSVEELESVMKNTGTSKGLIADTNLGNNSKNADKNIADLEQFFKV